ncbi:hypothetical protein Tco_0439935 [Tanacetum coccineum]
MALQPRDQRHQYLRHEGLQYTDVDIVDFETRLARIYMREMHMVQVFDFGGLPEPSTLSKLRAELRRESDFKCVKAKEKSNLKTSL